MSRRFAVLLPVLAAVLLGLLSGCEPRSRTEQLTLAGRTMGTTWSVVVAAPDPALDAASLETALAERLVEINALMSTYDPDSELSRFNAAPAGEWFEVHPELLEVLEIARELAALTDGALDVTIGPLVNLWGFGAAPGKRRVPDDAAIADALASSGFDRLALRSAPPALRKAGALYVDLSAIAKGYAVDELAELLDEAGVERYLVEIGGEIRVRGRNARGVPWQVGIERPDASRRAVARTAIGLETGAVATSGDYRNFFSVDGVRYSHTIDPSTGRPVSHDVASVTVIHPSAAWADGWATALNVLGAERGLAVAQARGLPVSFTRYDGDLLTDSVSPDFRPFLDRNEP